MRQSNLFTKTRKESPKDEVSRNADLLIRAGFIHKEIAGVYAFLPLGLSVLNNICAVIREEMNAIGGQELLLTALQDKAVWEKTGRWNDDVIDVWFKTLLANGSETGLATTHEEPLTSLMKEYISSYRDLPCYSYQIQTKFRNEARAKSGIMRGREFLMKDLYSFSRSQEEQDLFYEKVKEVYITIFSRLGIGDKTFVTFASGGSFSKYSHEFQTITEAGEDTIYLDREKKIAINKEVYNDEVLADIGLVKEDLEEVTAVEVGNIFSLGTRFSGAFELSYRDEEGKEQPVIMGSYGIGPTRVMGTIVEVLSDEKGIVWPESIAPYRIHLLTLGEDEEVKERAEKYYAHLLDRNETVLYDDRAVRAGEKFADADLIGIPYQVIVSQKNSKAGVVEIKKRASGESFTVSEEEFFNQSFDAISKK